MEELKQRLVKDINNAKLPAECIYYIIKDIFRDIETSYNNYLLEKKINEEKVTEDKKLSGNK